ncbi:MAG: asparagine synthase (glutamine-hydrolyzing) [Crocinitomicaceae bacterium]|nr:asparagine synthase (glutamine-hydrolyzing) [Crocinitomicaceae bacterium]
MCGINGFIDFKARSSNALLKSMTSTLAHRGPDGEGTEFIELPQAQIGLGHRRLAILDLSDQGKQPMRFGSYWMCFNGEIYNFIEIRNELESRGHTFSGNSDSEMILHAYQEWGAKCLDRFIGMFAIFIYNEKDSSVFCARDRAGVKPFFFYMHDGLFMFASELKAFHAHTEFKKSINKDAVAAFMQYGNVPTPYCIFDYCSKIRPGHYFTIDLNNPPKDLEQIKQVQYWNVYDSYNSPKLDISYEEAKIETSTLLKSAFNYRMVSDVPVGVFLSGGFDSACVTAILQKDRTEQLKTFTIGVPDIGLNEAPYAKELAHHLGTNHTEITCTQKEALELIKDLPFFFDEPFADSSAIPTTLVSRMARKEVTVALSADAGDEIFAGYNRYDYLLRYGKKLERIPGFARKSMANIMRAVPSERIPVLRNKYNFHNRYEKLKNVLQNPSNEHIMLSLSQQFTDTQMKEMMEVDFHHLETYYASNEMKGDFSPLSYMMAIDYQTYLIDDILQKVDRSTMSQSLEGREPFLDQRIIEFAAQLPDSYKYHNGVKKRILRDLVYEYVPKEMMDRPKMGFAIPIAEWLKNDLRDLVEEYICESKIKEQGLLNWEYVSKIKEAFYNGKKEYDFKVWYMLTFQMWYAKWMEK